MDPHPLFKTGAIYEVYRHDIRTHSDLVRKSTLNLLLKLFVYKLRGCEFE